MVLWNFNMDYTLINKTKISTKLLKKLINLCCPTGVKNFRIEFKNFNKGAFLGKSFNNKITIYINPKIKLPCYNVDRNLEQYGYGRPIILKTKEEVLLNLISHELQHLWQNNNNFNAGQLYIFSHLGNIYTSY